ncbi:MAG: hypothetical protein HOO17_10435, partial [Bacteroidetes Order II. Incertae sedis bacterium]|nr:hypothetical protein [Bacteroidetes Order II. bacterium]
VDYSIFFRKLSQFGIESEVAPFLVALDAWYLPDSDDLQVEMSSWLERYRLRMQECPWGEQERTFKMNATNPKYILRNYLAQMAIEQASEGEYGMVTELLEVMRNPYDEQPEFVKYAKKRPEWAMNKPGSSMLSCSS